DRHVELAVFRPRHRTRLRVHRATARGAAERCHRVEEGRMTAEQDWREKYRDALSKLSAEEARWAKHQNIMKLLIGRLCLAWQGRDERLDRDLARVADSVRRNIDLDVIDSMLAPLSAAVAVLDAKASTSASGSRSALKSSTTGTVPAVPEPAPTAAAGNT